MVEKKLKSKKQNLTADAYYKYRVLRTLQRETKNTIDDDIAELISGESEYWNDENSNKSAKVLNTQEIIFQELLVQMLHEDIFYLLTLFKLMMME